MEYFNNTLCIEAGWLFQNDILSESNYKRLTRKDRNGNSQIEVMRRGGGYDRTALVAYESIPYRFQKKICSIIGDPFKAASNSTLKDLIIEDDKARKFYREYLMDNEEHLPVDAQKEYTINASILNAIHQIVTSRPTRAKALGGSSKGMWQKLAKAVLNIDKTVFKHSLPPYAKFDENGEQLPLSPSAYRKLQDRYRKYVATDNTKYDRIGYESLIHGNWCNKNSEKINDEAKIWILSRWTSMVDRIATEQQLLNEYNQLADAQGWKGLRSVDAIHNFLYQEEIKGLWWGARFGELKFKEKFAYQQKTVLPSMRDSLWYSDGTKLNYFYQTRDANGKFQIKTVQVYEVMDVFSECLLGYHISKSEDFEAQYNAYRMSLEFSQHKPYEIRYDNQGGHKKLEAGDFLTKLSHLSIRTKPHNGKSKTIESAFGRFQSEFLKKDWFFTGQNIQSKKQESKANMEFIMANKYNLPTLEEIHKVYKKRRDEWQNAKRPNSNQSRINLYRESQNPKAVKLELMDMVDLFWVLRKKPVRCSAWGIKFEEKGTPYDYMVMLPNGLPDVRWLVRNIDKKFRIKFDPQDFSIIYLYEDTPQGLRFITSAEQKVEVHRNIQEQQEWEASWMKQVDEELNNMRLEIEENIRSIQEKHHQLPEQHGLVSPAIKGINNPKKKKAQQKADNFGRLQKAMSNAVMAGGDDEEFDDNDMYGMI